MYILFWREKRESGECCYIVMERDKKEKKKKMRLIERENKIKRVKTK